MGRASTTEAVARFARWQHLLIRASAGTGKTFQLSNRYLDLLAGDVPCDEILATTFTRKAAGEILERILFRLAEATHDEKQRKTLGKHLACGEPTREKCLDLLARATRNLHRLRVGTLDSFFMSIAGSFSLELGLPADWTIADEVTDRALRIEAMRAALAQNATSDLLTLLHLLSKGETTRSVTTLVHDTVDNLYDIFQETDETAWQRLNPCAALPAAEVEAILDKVQDIAMPTPQIAKGRDGDLEKARAGDWGGFIKGGIAAKVLAGETTITENPSPTKPQDITNNY
jgi:ATP-dependent exoDNAse (exonuclease V) beta subunit